MQQRLVACYMNFMKPNPRHNLCLCNWQLLLWIFCNFPVWAETGGNNTCDTYLRKFFVGASPILHYQSSFFIQHRKQLSSNDLWEFTQSFIYQWVLSKYPTLSGQLNVNNFNSGGRFENSQLLLDTITYQFQSGASSNEPTRLWAVRLRHLCSQERCREWEEQVIVTRPSFATKLIVTIKNQHRQSVGYLGPRPLAPSPFAAELAVALFDSPFFKIYKNNLFPLVDRPLVLASVEQAQEFLSLMQNPQRNFPLVLVSDDLFLLGQPSIDLNSWAQLLRGIGSVYYLPQNSAAYTFLYQKLGTELFQKYFAINGQVRVYPSSLILNNQQVLIDYHPYTFSWQDLKKRPEEVLERIFHALTSATAIETADHLPYPMADFEDIFKFRTWRLLQQQAARTLGNQELIDHILEENSILTKKMTEMEELHNKVVAENITLNHRLSSVSRAADPISIRPDLSKLRMLEVLKLIQERYQGRIVFTEKALQTAKSLERSFRGDLQIFYQAMVALAHDMHDLRFLPQREFGSPEFSSETLAFNQVMRNKKLPFEVSSESRTLQTSDLASQRKDRYNGKVVYAFTHLKYGNRPNFQFRIHFFFDDDHQWLVISAIVEHYDTISGPSR